MSLGAFTRAIRNISRRKTRALLVIVALSFSLAIMISIPAGVVANQESTQNLTQNYNSTILATEEQINQTTTLIEVSSFSGRGIFSSNFTAPAPGSYNFSGSPGGFGGFGGSLVSRTPSYLGESIVGNISAVAGIEAVVPSLTVSSSDTTQQTISTPRGDFTINRPLYTITGVSLNFSLDDEYPILPTDIVSGTNLNESNTDTGVVLMSVNLTEYYGVGVGGQVTLDGGTFKVVGIYNPSDQGSLETRGVYMSLNDAQNLTGEVGNVSTVDVYAENASLVDNINTQIQTMYSSEIQAGTMSVTTYSDRLANLENEEAVYTETLNSAESTVAQTQSIATQEIIVALVATSLIVLFVMLYTVRERTKEIGTLKAIGFSSWSIMKQFMLEGVILSLAAGLVGIGIGTVGAPLLSGYLLPSVNLFGSRGGGFGGGFAIALSSTRSVSSTSSAAVTPMFMLLALGAAVALGAVGSLYPAWRASRTRPAEAMRYE